MTPSTMSAYSIENTCRDSHNKNCSLVQCSPPRTLLSVIATAFCSAFKLLCGPNVLPLACDLLCYCADKRTKLFTLSELPRFLQEITCWTSEETLISNAIADQNPLKLPNTNHGTVKRHFGNSFCQCLVSNATSCGAPSSLEAPVLGLSTKKVRTGE